MLNDTKLTIHSEETLKTKGLYSGIAAIVFILLAITGTANAQVQKDYFVLDFGAAYTQATVVNAKSGFFGLDIFAGKMLTNNLCLGFSSGYDVVSFEKVGDSNERLGMFPFLL